MGTQRLSTSDSKTIKEAITEFYKLAGMQPPPIDGDVSEKTAEIFHKMYNAAAECSKAMDLVPRPSGGPPGPISLVLKLAGSFTRHYSHRGKFTEACVAQAIRNWESVLTIEINN